MSISIKLFGMAFLFLAVSCTETTEEATEAAPANTETTTTSTETRVETQAPQESEGTTISIGEDGAKVQTKDTKVEVTDKAAEIVIKK